EGDRRARPGPHRPAQAVSGVRRALADVAGVRLSQQELRCKEEREGHRCAGDLERRGASARRGGERPGPRGAPPPALLQPPSPPEVQSRDAWPAGYTSQTNCLLPESSTRLDVSPRGSGAYIVDAESGEWARPGGGPGSGV